MEENKISNKLKIGSKKTKNNAKKASKKKLGDEFGEWRVIQMRLVRRTLHNRDGGGYSATSRTA
jgi:hypothetical protein